MCKEVDQSVSSDKPKKDPVRLPPPTAPAQLPENALVPPKRKPATDPNASPRKAVDDENAELSELQLSDTASESAPSKPAPAPEATPEPEPEPKAAPAEESPANTSTSSDEPSESSSDTEQESESGSTD